MTNVYLCGMKKTLTINSLSDLDVAARKFLEMTDGRRLVAFYAPMGAGKTTFTVALCKALGVEDSVCSPTFTIVNEYRTSFHEPVYHFDFYRIKNNAEAMDIGIEDYFYSGNLCLMEWPENIEDLLPEETLRVCISVGAGGERILSWEE